MELPKVSVIITNRNYGRFLERAIGSVRAQTYPHHEIIVVDDASTDDSVAILERLIADGAPVTLVRLTENVGQGTASRRGFEASSGAYVVLLDADDRLLPDFMKVHLFAQMSSRIAVGFSSSDVIQVAGGQVVRYSYPGLWRGLREVGTEGRSRIGDVSDRLPAELACPGLLARIHYRPHGRAGWVWAPTSANLFRRDALAYLFRTSATDARRSFDGAILRVLSSLFGSLLVDVPLSEYTVHDSNLCTTAADLDGLHTWSLSDDAMARRMGLDFFLDADPAAFGPGGVEPSRFVVATAALMGDCRDLLDRSEMEAMIARFAARFGPATGQGPEAVTRRFAHLLSEREGRRKRKSRRLGPIGRVLSGLLPSGRRRQEKRR